MFRLACSSSSRAVARAWVLAPRMSYSGAANGLTAEDATRRLLSVVQRYPKLEGKNVTVKSHFSNDLGLDSLDTVELLLDVETEFNVVIPDQEADSMTSVADALAHILSNPNSK